MGITGKAGRAARRGLCAWILWCAGLVLATPGAWGQAEVYLEVRKGEQFRVPLLIETFSWEGLDPVVFQGRERAEEVLARDLVNAGAFIVIRQGQSDPLPGEPFLDVDGRVVDRAPQARVRARVQRVGGGLRLHGALIDESSGRSIFERSFAIAWDAARLAADRWGIHRFADEIVFYLTGTRGCAATCVAFVRAGTGDARDLYLIDSDGMQEVRLTNLAALALSPAWHPSGRSLAFTTFSTGMPSLQAADPATGSLALLSDQPTPTAPAFARDGRYLAYSTTADGNAEIYISHADGSEPRRLTHNAGIDTAPSWSPGGQRLVFTSDRWGSPQLFTVNIDGSDLRQLTFAGSWNDSPDWSPTGDRIVHVCMIEGSFELALIHADGWGWRRLTVGGRCENPRWAPDGRHVVYARAAGGARALWVLDTDLGTVRRLTGLKGQRYNPAWSFQAKERPGPPNQGR